MNHCSRKIGYRFCSTQAKFYAAQIVLKNFYGIQAKERINNKLSKIPLPFKIQMDLQKLKSSRSEEDSTPINQIIDYFEPTKGINTYYLLQRQKRLTLGQNENNLLPLCPHLIVTKKIMRSLYDWDRYNLKFIPASTDCTVDYIVGTPGIAKSTTMLMIKYFNEMRISYILSNECPSNSQFKINYKIFYFQANYTQQEVTMNITYEVNKDFPNSPQIIIEENEQNKKLTYFQKWIKAASKKYSDKNFIVKVVIDQCNMLYSQKKVQYQKQVNNWKFMANIFMKPTVLISSKNNNFWVENDPIETIANDYKNGINKIIVDNQVSPQQRVQYSVDCLSFQMRKIGIKNQDIYKMLKDIKYFPMTTHLICRSVCYYNKTLQLIKNKLQQNFNSQSVQRLQANVNELVDGTSKKYQQNKKQYFLDIQTFVNIMKFTRTYKTKNEKINIIYPIQAQLSQQEKLNNSQIFKIKEQYFKTQEQLKQMNFNYLILKDYSHEVENRINFTNYFFYHYDEHQHAHKLYTILTEQQIKQIQNTAIGVNQAQYFRKWKKFLQHQFYCQLLDQLKGKGFQGFLISLFNRYMNKENTLLIFRLKYKVNVTMFYFQKQSQPLPKFNTNKNRFHYSWGQTQQQIQKKMQLIVNKLTSRNCCFQAYKQNVAFDFLLSQYKHEQLRLYFIDASTGKQKYQKNQEYQENQENQENQDKQKFSQKKKHLKINNFKKLILKNNKVFLKLMEQLQKTQKIAHIQIHFIVLKPNYPEFTNYYEQHSIEKFKHLLNKRLQNTKKIQTLTFRESKLKQEVDFMAQFENKEVSVLDQIDFMIQQLKQKIMKSVGSPKSLQK